MAWVERRITRVSQPQDAVGIDGTNAIAKRFAFLMLPTVGNTNLVNGEALTKTGTFTNAPTPAGVGANFVGTTSDRLGEYLKNPGGVAMPNASAGLTMFAVVVPNTVSTQQTIASFSRSGTQNTRTRIEISGTGKAAFVIRHLANGTAASVNGVTTLAVGAPYVIVGTSVNQSLHKVYLNGVLEAQSATTISSGASDWDSLFVGLDGVSNPGYTLPANCKILMFGAARGALSDAEVKSLSENPWQLLEPEVQRIWVDDYVSAGGGATVIPIGVQATGSVGTPSATGAATTTPAGVSASSAVGTPVAVGGASIPATVLPAGVQVVAAIGTATAIGAAVAQPAGVTASGAVGAPVAIGETAGVTVVYPAGVQAVAAVGTPGVIAAARVIPIGVQAMGEVGEPLAYAGDTPPVVATSNYGFEMSAGKRYYIKRKGKILLFNSAEQADDYLAVEQQATVVTSRGAKKRIAAKLVKVAPIETIELEPVTELLSRYMPEVSLPNLLKMRDIEQVIAMQQQALMMQDDEDIELLLMTL